MKTAALIFPNQLFADHPVIRENPDIVLLIEDSLYFGDRRYPARFHKQKIAYHRATMQAYLAELKDRNLPASLVAWEGAESQLAQLVQSLAGDGVQKILCCELNDFILEMRLSSACEAQGLPLATLPTPGFINTTADNQQWLDGRKKWLMADYYQWQRTRTGILMEGDEPEGGKWSFDEDNRKKLPAKKVPHLPSLPDVSTTREHEKIIAEVNKQFPDNPGKLEAILYPSTHQQAQQWLDTFCAERLESFGAYEDAIVEDENWLYHSVLTPMLNVGLLTPQQVLDAVLKAHAKHRLPLNSVEGFIRQVLGWREFMRASYVQLGVAMRTGNHWQHERDIPACFYNATTGIEPVDNTIRRVLDTGYCHHIERLMVLGGFMFLCELKPDAVYRWFMEMYIDSYDWVMVPNVYAMSQHADGGLITTKPYFSGSNYIRKMSQYPKGEWADIWDALFWRWIDKNKDRLAGNHRWAMMCKNVERMDEQKLSAHKALAEEYLDKLHG